MGELDDGELYYREKVLPRALVQSRRIRCVLMTNAPRSRALAAAARVSDTDIIAEKDLRRLLRRFEVPPSSIGRWLGIREASLQSLQSSLASASEAD